MRYTACVIAFVVVGLSGCSRDSSTSNTAATSQPNVTASFTATEYSDQPPAPPNAQRNHANTTAVDRAALTARLGDAIRDASGRDVLALGWLTELSPEHARMVAKWAEPSNTGDWRADMANAMQAPRSRKLKLDGLTSLSTESARALSSWCWRRDEALIEWHLSLNGLTSLDTETAHALAEWGGHYEGARHLSLNGVTLLNSATAGGLATWGSRANSSRILSLNGLRALDPATAAALGTWRTADLVLIYPTDPRCCCELQLDGLSILSAESAQELARLGSGDNGKCALTLNGLRFVDREVAHALAEWGKTNSGPRVLSLNGLAELTAESASGLARWCQHHRPRTLNLNGLASLDVVAARALAAWTSDTPGVRTLSLNGLSSLSAGTSVGLAGKCGAGNFTLLLDGITALAEEPARGLARWGARVEDGAWCFLALHLNGIADLTAAGAGELAAWGRDTSNRCALYLNGLHTLDGDVAEALTTWGSGSQRWCTWTLFLDGIAGLAEAPARALGAWGAGDDGERTLSMRGLSALDANSSQRLVQRAVVDRDTDFNLLLNASLWVAVAALYYARLALYDAAFNAAREALRVDESEIAYYWAGLSAYGLALEAPSAEHKERLLGLAITNLRGAVGARKRGKYAATALFTLGVIYETLGQRELAGGSYRECLALEPDHPAASEALNRLDHDPETPDPDTPSSEAFTFLREERFSCGGQTHTVKIYRCEAFARALGLSTDSGETDPACEFVMIPAGEFAMGSPTAETGRDEDEVQRTINITRPFLLARTELTQRVWHALRDEMSSAPSAFDGDRNPIEQVWWSYADEWCRMNGLRLPSEAEWEYACRAGTNSRFCFGERDDGLSEYDWFSGNAGSRTHSVGEKKPNAFGLYDMHGNVSEWCQDWYGEYADAPTDGSPQTSTHRSASGATTRVYRGGAWGATVRYCRSANRGSLSDVRSEYIGIRPAGSLPD